ncbi:MAG: cyclase family protein [Verrucomicrobia bacterium]|nr:cyclase family protein [Verrucomicrobiota bacterium]
MDDKRWILLSYSLEESSPLPPGIPPMSRTARSSLAAGDDSNVVDIFFCNHSGTHVDAPLHFAADGKCITEFDINEFRFRRPLVLDLPVPEDLLVRPEHLEPHETAIRGCDLLLLRTGFSSVRRTDPERYRLHGPGLSEAAARYIAGSFPELRAIGLDSISLASMDRLDEGIRAHQVLLGGARRFLIVEDMNLDLDLSGLIEVMVLPFMIAGIDGSPCTVVGVVRG